MTCIGFIRHGETAWNNEGRLQGQRDIALSEEGKSQASALANRLADEHWDLLCCSDLKRAEETARIIADRLSLPRPVVDLRLRERDFGLLEGTTLEERVQRWGEQWSLLDLGVESNESVQSRALAFVNDLVMNHANKKVLVVSHGSTLGQLLIRLLGQPKQERIHNTSLSILHKQDERWEEVLFNCTAHLEE